METYPETNARLCAKIEQLRTLITKIVKANADFRAGMAVDWEGDPLQDAIEEAQKELK